MGLLAKLVCLAIGGYAGVYADQNYELPRVPSPSEMQAKIEEYIDQYRKS